MPNDYRVRSLSDDLINRWAERTRKSQQFPVDVVAILSASSIDTINGKKQLKFIVKEDSELADNDAITIHMPAGIEVHAKRSVKEGALFGDARPRFTLAHEIGHVVLGHDKAPMARATSVNKAAKKSSFIAPYESAETQANKFSANLQIGRKTAEIFDSAEEISVYFGVSLETANITLRKINSERNRLKNLTKFRSLAAEIRAEKDIQPQLKFLEVSCNNCGAKTLFPVGNKFMCNTCEFVSDQFSDGD